MDSKIKSIINSLEKVKVPRPNIISERKKSSGEGN